MFNELTNQLFAIFSMLADDEPQSSTFIMSVLVQVFLIVIILFAIYKKFIKGTSSEKLVKGIFILIIAWFVGDFLDKINLQILGTFLKITISIISFSLVVIFQPELRKFIGFIGQTTFWKQALFGENDKDNESKVNILKELTEAVKYLSKTKTGGLIVLQNSESKIYNAEVAKKIDAMVSTELLLTIFFPNTPLHDGAVIIHNEKVKYAGALLPLTEDPKLSWRYGTRHRAAIGVTEVSDCACIVVSEETGDISIALDGTLKKYESITDFRTDLMAILKIKEEKDEKPSPKIFDFKNIVNKENLNK